MSLLDGSPSSTCMCCCAAKRTRASQDREVRFHLELEALARALPKRGRRQSSRRGERSAISGTTVRRCA